LPGTEAEVLPDVGRQFLPSSVTSTTVSPSKQRTPGLMILWSGATTAVRHAPEPLPLSLCRDRATSGGRQILPYLIDWQKKHHYPLTFACEATLNIARQTEILAMMREARFDTVFVGIETPEVSALESMDKKHNASVPMAEAIRILNGYGMEVVSGIILGLDTDTPDTEKNLKEFIDRSEIPMLTMNLLQALPKTPLWDRLARDRRLVSDSTLESNVRFLRPYEEVVATWRRCIAYAYDRGELGSLLSVGFVSYHLIEFARDALRGNQNASFYSTRPRPLGRAQPAFEGTDGNRR
jgi:hypothetical protein